MERSTTLSLVLKIEDLQARATGAEAANVRLTLLPVQLAELQATHDKLRVDATATGVKLEAANEHIARWVQAGMASLMCHRSKLGPNPPQRSDSEPASIAVLIVCHRASGSARTRYG